MLRTSDEKGVAVAGASKPDQIGFTYEVRTSGSASAAEGEIARVEHDYE